MFGSRETERIIREKKFDEKRAKLNKINGAPESFYVGLEEIQRQRRNK